MNAIPTYIALREAAPEPLLRWLNGRLSFVVHLIKTAGGHVTFVDLKVNDRVRVTMKPEAKRADPVVVWGRVGFVTKRRGEGMITLHIAEDSPTAGVRVAGMSHDIYEGWTDGVELTERP